MILCELRIQNFMPYFGEHTLNMEPSGDANVVLVFGDNMGGKTSLLNALRWCLYGTAYLRGGETKGIGLSDLLNKIAREAGQYQFFTLLKFTHDGSIFEVRRSASARNSAQAPRDDYDFEVRVSLKKDGSMVSSGLQQAMLRELFPQDIARFMLFDGELLQEYEELLEPGSAHGKRIGEAIEKALGIPSLSQGRDEFASLKKKYQKLAVADAKQVQGQEVYAREAERLQTTLDSQEKERDDLDAQDASTADEIRGLDEKLRKVDQEREQFVRMEEIGRTQQTLSDRLDGIAADRIKCMKSAWLDLLVPRISIVRDQLERKQQEFQNSLIKYLGLSQRKAEIESALQEARCQTCRQVLPSESKDTLVRQLAAIEETLRDESPGIRDNDAMTARLHSLRSFSRAGIAGSLRGLRSEEATSLVRLEQIETELAELEQALQSYDSTEDTRLRSKRDQLLRHQGTVKTKLREVGEAIDDNQDKLDRYSAKSSLSTSGRHRRTSLLAASFEHLEKLFKNSIHTLRDELRATVEQKASDAFKSMTTDQTYRGLRINEQFGLSIIGPDGHEVPLRSAGAEQVVALSLIMALNDTSRTRGAVVMDTPFGRLDPKHRENILRAIPNLAQQVVLLVHEGELDRLSAPSQLGAALARSYSIEHRSSFESSLVPEQFREVANG